MSDFYSAKQANTLTHKSLDENTEHKRNMILDIIADSVSNGHFDALIAWDILEEFVEELSNLGYIIEGSSMQLASVSWGRV